MIFSFKKLSASIKWPFITLFFLLLVSLLFTIFFPIPTDSNSASVGIGATLLDIGDREFYINLNKEDYGIGDIKGSFLYPNILSLIRTISIFFGQNETSKLWNFLIITITSLISIINLFLIDRSSWNIFGSDVAKIANWIYVLCPYTLFYALNGSITMYMMLGISFCTYIITNSYIFRKDQESISFLKTYFYLLIGLVYLSLIRPTGALFGIVLILILYFLNKQKINSNQIKVSKDELIWSTIFTVIIISVSIFQLIILTPYLTFSLNNFINEKGYFFGVEREILRKRLIFEDGFIISLKNFLYFISWKISDFISGISDIRDTHSQLNSRPLFPFLIRVFTGLFYIYPINLLSLFSIFKFRKRLIDSGLILIIISAFIIISPSLIGVAFSRYLLMVYPPVIICAAKTIDLLLKD